MPGWLEAYARFFSAHPDLQAGGGPIDIDWSDMPRPTWWQPQFDVNLAGLALPANLVTFPEGEFPFGPNMYISATAFREVGPFNPRLGPKGKVNHVGEETEWFIRYAAQGGKIGYVSDAIVRHWADPAKATKRSLLIRSWRAGQAVAVLPEGGVDARGWLAWLRHAASATLKGRLTFPEQVYLANWLGRLSAKQRPAK